MTDALKKLIEAVEAGERPWREPNDDEIMHSTLILASFDGSLDAAKALHDILLPGWRYRVEQHRAEVWDTSLWVDDNDNPARAWLLAILKAKLNLEST